MIPFNLLSKIPAPLDKELFQTLLKTPRIRVERIISPPGTRSQEFAQQQDEWVVLIQGNARLDLDGETLDLQLADSLFIAAGTPHQVLDTSADPPCIWLAIHIFEDERSG